MSALASEVQIPRPALDVFLTCASQAGDRTALTRGCREIERLLLFDHPWHRRCQVEVLGGGQLQPRSAPANMRPEDRAEWEAQQLRERADFAGCARALNAVERSYSGMMLRLDCAELSNDNALLRDACRRYIDARIPAQTRWNPRCEEVLRAGD